MCIILAVMLTFMTVDAGKVLLIPLLYKSHIIELNILGETLARRGHDVYAALPDNSRFAAMFDDDSSSAIKRLTFVVVDAGKVLLIPLLFKSHIIEQKILGETLARRGHDVHVALPDNSPFAAMFDNDSSAI